MCCLGGKDKLQKHMEKLFKSKSTFHFHNSDRSSCNLICMPSMGQVLCHRAQPRKIHSPHHLEDKINTISALELLLGDVGNICVLIFCFATLHKYSVVGYYDPLWSGKS